MPFPSLEVFETEISRSSRVILNKKPEIATDDSENIPNVTNRGMSLVGFQWFQTLGPLEVNQTHGPNIGDSLLVEQADFDDNYHILATTCHTLQRYHYLGLIFSIDDTRVNRNPLEFPELRSLAVFCNDDMVPLLRPLANTAISS